MIVCPNCNHHLEKIKVIAFDIEYLEGILTSFFSRPMSDLRSISEFAKERHFKGTCFYIIKKYGGLSLKDIQARYSCYNSRFHYHVKNINTQTGDVPAIEQLIIECLNQK